MKKDYKHPRCRAVELNMVDMLAQSPQRVLDMRLKSAIGDNSDDSMGNTPGFGNDDEDIL